MATENNRSVAKLLALSLSALLVGCGGGGGPDENDSAGPLECSVAVWGDSIAVDLAASIKLARPRYRTEDYTISGSSAEGRLPVMLATPVSTRVSVVQWGMNDLPFTTPDLYAESVDKMVQHVHSGGGVAVVTGVSGTIGFYDDKRTVFNLLVERVARKNHAPFAGWPSVPYAVSDLPDGVHPVGGYKSGLVARLVAVLDDVAPECAQ